MADNPLNRSSTTVVITVTGLRSDLIGAFGAFNARTPNIDDLAGRSIVLDRLFADSADTSEQLRSIWTGSHALKRSVQSTGSTVTLFNQIHDVSAQATFLSDSLEAAELAERAGCSDASYCGTPEVERTPVSEPIRCSITAPLLHGADLLVGSHPVPDLLWIHCDGLRRPWDAPLDLRSAFCDPEDPDPPAEVCYPDIQVDTDTDPDLLIGWSQVAAAQIAAFDEAAGILLDAIRRYSSASGQQCNILLLGLGGIPLGEHGKIGGDSWGLHETTLACPAIVSLPSRELPVGIRQHDILQLPDVGATLRRLFEITAACEWGMDCLVEATTPTLFAPPAPLDRAIVQETRHTSPASSVQSTWFRTPAWSLHTELELDEQSGAGHAPSDVTAFVMPDDRWERSDVARRSIGVVAQLADQQQLLLKAINTGSRDQLTILDETLTNLMR